MPGSQTMKEPFDEGIYTLVSLTKLAIFAISKIAESGEECAYERIVKECFTLFPRRFSFQRYHEWPDGARIKLEISRCRDKGWTKGNEKNGWQITSSGTRKAQEVLKELRGSRVKKPQKKRPRDRGQTIINHLKESEPFKRFKQAKEVFYITEEELRKLLVATFETPHRVLKQNLNFCSDVCEQYGERQLVEFLKECEKQQESLLKSHTKGRRK